MIENRTIVIQYVGNELSQELVDGFISTLLSSGAITTDKVAITRLDSRETAIAIGKTMTGERTSEIEQALVYITAKCGTTLAAPEFSAKLTQIAMVELAHSDERMKNAIMIVTRDHTNHPEALKKFKITKTYVDAIVSIHNMLY